MSRPIWIVEWKTKRARTWNPWRMFPTKRAAMNGRGLASLDYRVRKYVPAPEAPR